MKKVTKPKTKFIKGELTDNERIEVIEKLRKLQEKMNRKVRLTPKQKYQ